MFSCGFYDAIDDDRVYSATQFGEMFDGLITDGIYATIGNAFAVVPGTGVQIKVRSGRAWFNKRWSVNTADFPIDLADPDLLLPRIDAVILEVDTRVITRNNAIKVITGEPNVNPVKPTLTRADGLYQYPLAWVRVDQNVETITASKIENNIGKTPTPFVTGILKAITIDELWNQWEGQFDEWFADLQAQLSGDVAVNLQNQVNALKSGKVNISDKATTTNAQNGTNDTQWMTPLKTKQHVDGRLATASEVLAGTSSTKLISPSSMASCGVFSTFFKSIGHIKCITVTSTKIISVPTDIEPNTYAFIFCVGGGGGGGGASVVVSANRIVAAGGGGGGSGGFAFGSILFDRTLNVTIGTGGTGGTYSFYNGGTSTKIGGNGGTGSNTTVSNGIEQVIAIGGNGGTGGKSSITALGSSSSTPGQGGIGFAGGGGGAGYNYATSSGTNVGSGGAGTMFGGGGGSALSSGGAYGRNNTNPTPVFGTHSVLMFVKTLLEISNTNVTSFDLLEIEPGSSETSNHNFGGGGFYCRGGGIGGNVGSGGGGAFNGGTGGSGFYIGAGGGGGGGGGIGGNGGNGGGVNGSNVNNYTKVNPTNGSKGGGGGGGGCGAHTLTFSSTDSMIESCITNGGNGSNGFAYIFYVAK